MTKTNGKPTYKDLYELLDSKFSRFEAKLDGICERYDKRIDTLENGQAKMFGGIVVVGVVWQWILNNFR